jgi:hypothetical protein
LEEISNSIEKTLTFRRDEQAFANVLRLVSRNVLESFFEVIGRQVRLGNIIKEDRN